MPDEIAMWEERLAAALQRMLDAQGIAKPDTFAATFQDARRTGKSQRAWELLVEFAEHTVGVPADLVGPVLARFMDMVSTTKDTLEEVRGLEP